MERKKRELSPWGRQCKAQMILMGKTLDSLSRETSLSRSYISAIINGRVVVPDETVKLISSALEVEMPLVEQ